MTRQLESSLVRIYSNDQHVVGAGFLVTDRWLITCVHVVSRALCLSDDTLEPPQAEVYLDLPLVQAGHILTARVSLWQTMVDVAGLELVNAPPAGARPARLAKANNLWNHTFRAFGFPAGYDGGVWASGVLRGRQADGWIQIEDVKQTGYFVQPGFSGAPVWDEELDGVVGMIVAADTTSGVRVAFLIPTEMLASIWPQTTPNALLDAKEVGARPRVVNLLPLDMTHTFKDRQREIQALRDHLADEHVRLVSVVGRGGWGKTALACHVLADLQKSMLLNPGAKGERPVDGILYLGARTTSLGFERICADVGRMLGEPAASKLAARWTHGDTSLVARIGYMLEAMQDGLYLILLDNLEDYLTEEGEITEEGLRLFVERCLLQPGGAQLIVTSRQQIRLPAAALPRVRSIPMDEGLPEDDAAALLHELDPQNELGLRDASQEDLQHAVRLTQGIPRALELVAGILDHDPTINLPQLLADERHVGKEVVEQLVAEGYSRLKDEDRRVMEALAVFDRPVEEKAIAYLLQPWFPNLDVRHNLRRLVGSYFVSANRSSGEYSLHPLDREYAYCQLPDGDEKAAYNKRNLELRTADFYASIRAPESEWKTIDDLTPQITEFEHRVRAQDFDGALQVLQPIDSAHLALWGQYSRLIMLRERLVGYLVDPHLEATNLGHIGNTLYSLGQVNQAIGFYMRAVTIARETGDRQSEGYWLGHLGSNYRAMGQIGQAMVLLKEALVISQEVGDRAWEGMYVGRLGSVHRDLGQVEQAIEYYRQALTIAREVGNRRDEGIWLGCLGEAYRIVGQFKQAIAFNQQSLAIDCELGDLRRKGARLGHLSIAYHNLGQVGQAVILCKEALAIAQEIKDRRNEVIWLNHLGTAYCAMRQTEQAIQLYEKALTVAHELGYRRGESYQLLGLGRALLTDGALSEAQACLAKALALDVDDVSHLAALLLGIVHLYQQDPGTAKSFADAATRSRIMLDKTATLYEPCYTLATAVVGQAVCDSHWVDRYRRDELLVPALTEYQRALDNCAAPGIVHDALRELELIRTAGIEGLEPVFELLNSALVQNRVRGCAVGAATGDALGMPLEFDPRRPADQLVRDMEPGRLPAGTFTDDTEMALALADSLLALRLLNPTGLAQHFVAWLQAGPDDVGTHTRNVLSRIAGGQPWEGAVHVVQRQNPDSAGNGSVMRCWPVALAHWDDLDQLLADSRLQSRVTHPHPECEAGSAFVNATINYLLHGASRGDAVAQALDAVDIPAPLRAVIEQAPTRSRDELQNSGWVRHTLESAVWGLLTTDTFEDAVVQVVNLGNDADTAGAVVGALAGAAYGIDAIPLRWQEALQGEWPLGSGTRWCATDLIVLADQLTRIDVHAPQALGKSAGE